MKTIQTKPDCTLGFIKMPDHIPADENFVQSFLNYFKKEGLEVKIEDLALGIKEMPAVVGPLSEITEEQAKELVKEMSNVSSTAGANTFMVYPSNNRELKLRPFVSSSSTSEPARYLKAIHSLYSAAESVGIEEKDFDQYLVIKI